MNPGNPKSLEAADLIDPIVGQKPVMTKARKSIANFKLREGRLIGTKVTLRGDRMWAFLDRLLNTALPRVRDFRGVSANSFDGRGNYTLGIRDQLIFPEIEYEKIDKLRGMEDTIMTTAKDDDQERVMLQLWHAVQQEGTSSMRRKLAYREDTSAISESSAERCFSCPPARVYQ